MSVSEAAAFQRASSSAFFTHLQHEGTPFVCLPERSAHTRLYISSMQKAHKHSKVGGAGWEDGNLVPGV